MKYFFLIAFCLFSSQKTFAASIAKQIQGLQKIAASYEKDAQKGKVVSDEQQLKFIDRFNKKILILGVDIVNDKNATSQDMLMFLSFVMYSNNIEPQQTLSIAVNGVSESRKELFKAAMNQMPENEREIIRRLISNATSSNGN